MEGKGGLTEVRLGRVGLGGCLLVYGRLRVAHMANNEFDDSSLQLSSQG